MGRVVSLRLKARSKLLNFVASEGLLNARRAKTELQRKVTGQRHVVSTFLELDDPYSYLLSHYLSELVEHFDIELRVYLTEAVTGPLRPAPELYTEYALADCTRVARELGIPFLDVNDTPPVEQRLALLDALAARADGESFANELFEAMAAYWRGDAEAVARRAQEASGSGAAALLQENQQKLESLGHYNTAMLHYGGEWYWGIDRLHYLVARLHSVGASKKDTPPGIASISQVMQVNLPVRPPAAAKDLPPLELFYSFRSPYSWLSLRRLLDIADAFGLEFVIRPVMPMAMRGMQVPRRKLLYIVADSSREARRCGVPYGRIADPIGPGVERCMAVLEYALSEKRERDFLLSAGEAIWGKGIDVATDDGLRKVTGKAGLFWPDAKAALDDEEWRMKAEANRADMMHAGSWGVPTIRVGDFVTWGQDRDWLIVRRIEEMCDSGEGILI
ncbi:MAG: DsbA family protein [Woeseiaceae bacterium]